MMQMVLPMSVLAMIIMTDQLMLMIQMITMSLNVHLMMRITVMIVHQEPTIHPMMVGIMMLMVHVMMVMEMMITMVH